MEIPLKDGDKTPEIESAWRRMKILKAIFKCIYFMYVGISPACMYTTCVQCPWKPEKGPLKPE